MTSGRALAPVSAALLAAVISVAPAPLAAAAARVELVEDGTHTVVELRGLESERVAALERDPPADWLEILALFTEVASRTGGELPAVLGSYSIEGDAVRFTPRFPLARGVTYVARWRDGPTGDTAEARFTLERPELPSSTVLDAVYPSVTDVPENLLRIYLQFSAPMSRGGAHDHIRLLDRSGEPVEGAFVAPERELWSPDGTRLTLFFDPGRIKRGVGPNAEVGPPLRAGESYVLVVDGDLADARGAPLVRGHRKELTVLPADREQPRTEDWRLQLPAGPDGEIGLGFPEPLDRALLEGLLTVLDPSGAPVEGETTVHTGERVWSFRPDGGWRAGVYRIRVPTILEDLAGNSLRRPFEVVLDGTRQPDENDLAYLDLPFAVQ